jgi:hypothetical protein
MAGHDFVVWVLLIKLEVTLTAQDVLLHQTQQVGRVRGLLVVHLLGSQLSAVAIAIHNTYRYTIES